MVSPYLIPGDTGMQLFRGLQERNVRVRVLTNSLESNDVLPAHAAYTNYRSGLLDAGVELYEVRPVLGKPGGSGGRIQRRDSGHFALHAKTFVFDGNKLFIGSMNFDQRSLHLNTELGLIIESPDLARTRGQVKRLSGMNPDLCDAVLERLTKHGFLRENGRNMFVRDDGSH